MRTTVASECIYPVDCAVFVVVFLPDFVVFWGVSFFGFVGFFLSARLSDFPMLIFISDRSAVGSGWGVR